MSTWLEKKKSDPRARLAIKQHRLTLDITQQLADAMERTGLTVTKLAGQLRKSKAWISKMIHGGRNLTLFTIVEAADALGCEVSVQLLPRQVLSSANSDTATASAHSLTLPRAPSTFQGSAFHEGMLSSLVQSGAGADDPLKKRVERSAATSQSLVGQNTFGQDTWSAPNRERTEWRQ